MANGGIDPGWTHRRLWRAAIAYLCIAIPASSWATIVRFDTTLGNIDVRMFDTATPASVANFLDYATNDAYDGSFIHRMPKAYDDHGVLGTFVVQGGGFKYSAAVGVSSIPTNPPVANEPGISNLKYTLAYAKLGGDPNSATSGFFFNAEDNANNLDSQNGGFTVFARIVDGFDVLDAIAALQAYDVDGSSSTLFDAVPLLNTVDPFEDILIFVNDVTVLSLPAGDYNFDGVVDLADYTVWRDSLGATTNVAADGNGDGVVDDADYGIWATSFGQASAGSATATGHFVPEPATACLLLGSLCLLIAWRKKSGPRMSRTHVG